LHQSREDSGKKIPNKGNIDMYGKLYSLLLVFLAVTLLPLQSIAHETAITKEIDSVDVIHNGQKVTIMRNQDTENTVDKCFIPTG
jgi:hypothetical protein